MNTLTTKKGTTLPLMYLKGKDYLQVAHRLVWFREEHPDWSIETEFVSNTDQSAIAKATIRNESGRVIATSHKEESLKDFPAGYREKAETGAIGRSLALCGYGTQFEPEFDEGSRIVDTPQPAKATVVSSAAVAAIEAYAPEVGSAPGRSSFKRIPRPSPVVTKPVEAATPVADDVDI